MDRFLQNNTVIKVIALLLALMLWLIVRMDDQTYTPVRQQTGELTIDNAKVEAMYDEELYSVVEMKDSVQVLLSGRRALLNLNQLRADPYRLFVDLTGLGAGSHRVPVQYEGFPSELQVDIIPSYINVVLEEKELKAFNVVIELTGAPREGFEVGTPVVNPEEVYVIAPPSVLDDVAIVKGFVNIKQIDEQLTERVRLKVYDQQGNEVNAEVSPETVEVNIPVRSPSKRVPLRVETVNELPDGLILNSIEPDYPEVEVFAPLSVLDKLAEIPIAVDLADITESGIVEYRIPVERNWIGVDPGVVNLDIQVEPVETRTFNQLPIQINSLPDHYEVQFLDPSSGRLDLLLSGRAQELQRIQAADIGVGVNVHNLSPGDHKLPIQVQVPSQLIAFDPDLAINIRIIDKNDSRETDADPVEDEEKEGE